MYQWLFDSKQGLVVGNKLVCKENGLETEVFSIHRAH